MKEEELVSAENIVDAVNRILMTTRRLFDPDDLLTVKLLVLLHFPFNLIQNAYFSKSVVLILVCCYIEFRS